MEPLSAIGLAVLAIIAACTRETEPPKTVADGGPDAGNPADTSSFTDATGLIDLGLPADLPRFQDSKDSGGVDAPVLPTTCVQAPLTSVPKLSKSPCPAGTLITDLDDSGWGICSDLFAPQKPSTLFKLFGPTIPLKGHADQVDRHGATLYMSGVSADGKRATMGRLIPEVLTSEVWDPMGDVLLDGEKDAILPNFAKGILAMETGAVMVTSDIDYNKPPAEQYQPGLLHVLKDGKYAQFPTGGKNPTGIGSFVQGGKTYLAVINSGAWGGTESVLTVMDAATFVVNKSLPLPIGGLGMGGEMDWAEGRLAIPSGDVEGRIAVVNTTTWEHTPLTDPAAGAKGNNFVVFAHLYGSMMAIGNFNTGKVSVLNVATQKQMGKAIQVDTVLGDKEGKGISDAACVGGNFFVVVGDEIWELK